VLVSPLYQSRQSRHNRPHKPVAILLATRGDLISIRARLFPIHLLASAPSFPASQISGTERAMLWNAMMLNTAYLEDVEVFALTIMVHGGHCIRIEDSVA